MTQRGATPKKKTSRTPTYCFRVPSNTYEKLRALDDAAALMREFAHILAVDESTARAFINWNGHDGKGAASTIRRFARAMSTQAELGGPPDSALRALHREWSTLTSFAQGGEMPSTARVRRGWVTSRIGRAWIVQADALRRYALHLLATDACRQPEFQRLMGQAITACDHAIRWLIAAQKTADKLMRTDEVLFQSGLGREVKATHEAVVTYNQACARSVRGAVRVERHERMAERTVPVLRDKTHASLPFVDDDLVRAMWKALRPWRDSVPEALTELVAIDWEFAARALSKAIALHPGALARGVADVDLLPLREDPEFSIRWHHPLTAEHVRRHETITDSQRLFEASSELLEQLNY